MKKITNIVSIERKRNFFDAIDTIEEANDTFEISKPAWTPNFDLEISRHLKENSAIYCHLRDFAQVKHEGTQVSSPNYVQLANSHVHEADQDSLMKFKPLCMQELIHATSDKFVDLPKRVASNMTVDLPKQAAHSDTKEEADLILT